MSLTSGTATHGTDESAGGFARRVSERQPPAAGDSYARRRAYSGSADHGNAHAVGRSPGGSTTQFTSDVGSPPGLSASFNAFQWGSCPGATNMSTPFGTTEALSVGSRGLPMPGSLHIGWGRHRCRRTLLQAAWGAPADWLPSVACDDPKSASPGNRVSDTSVDARPGHWLQVQAGSCIRTMSPLHRANPPISGELGSAASEADQMRTPWRGRLSNAEIG